MARKQAREISPHEREVMDYCEDVLSGVVVVGKLVRAAVERFLADLQDGPKRGLMFDYAAANRAIDFVQLLKHSTGEFRGKPFHLEPWQKFIFWNLFGWKWAATWHRRFRESFLSMGRGNGKSPLAAAILNCLLFLDKEARAELVIAAVERDQARIVFRETCGQVKSNKTLRERCEFFKNSLVYTSLGSTVVPLGKEAESKDGMNLHGFVADEVHAWKEEHKELWSKLETAMGKRRQPLSTVITTAGSDRSALWQRLYNLSSQVALGIFPDDAHFSLIYEVDPEDIHDKKGNLRDSFDESCYIKANPNLDISVKRDHLRRFNARGKVDPVVRSDFLRYHLNTRVRDAQKVILPAMWKKGSGELPELAGKACHAGLDLGWRDDLASFYLCFPLPERRFALRGWSWLPRHGRRDVTEAPWGHWIASGRIYATDGTTTDVESIQEHIGKVKKRVSLQTVSGDPNNARASLQFLVNHLGIKTYEFDQTARNYNEPVREFLKALAEGRILHGDDPVLTWAADNLVLRTNSAGLVMPDKLRSDEKIDPIVSAIMAFAGCIYLKDQAPDPEGFRVRWL